MLDRLEDTPEPQVESPKHPHVYFVQSGDLKELLKPGQEGVRMVIGALRKGEMGDDQLYIVLPQEPSTEKPKP